jgi:hypothetical protein
LSVRSVSRLVRPSLRSMSSISGAAGKAV